MRRWLCVQGAPTTSANVLVSLTRDTRMTRCWEGSRAQAGEDIWARFPQAALHSCSQKDLYAAGHRPGRGAGGGWAEPGRSPGEARSWRLDSYVDPGQDPKADLSVRKPGFCFFEKKS